MLYYIIESATMKTILVTTVCYFTQDMSCTSGSSEMECIVELYTKNNLVKNRIPINMVTFCWVTN